MERKKILHIITKGSPFGGAQKYVFDLATRLPKDQFESVVVLGAGEELAQKLAEQDIRVIQLPELGRDIDPAVELKVFWQLIKILREEQPNIVHLNSSKIGGLGALAVRIVNLLYYSRILNLKSKIICIFTAHGWAFNERRSKSSVLTIKFLSWITMLLAHKTITIARNEEAQAMNMPFVRHKIALIYNGIQKIEFKEKRDAQKSIVEKIRFPLDPHALWIGTIAELHKNKNLGPAIEAISMLSDKIVFVIIGEGEERAQLERKIAELHLEKRVFLAGKMEDASQYLKAFDIFILPSVKEGLPYTILEAGLAGLPTLSTYVGGIPEIMRNNISGVLIDPTTEKIRGGLEFLIAHPDKAEEFAKHLKAKVEKDFSIEKMLEQTMKVYLK